MSTTDGPRGAQTAGAAAAKIAVATTEIEVTTTHIAGEWRQAAALLVLREVAHARLRCDVLCIESASRLTRGCVSGMAHGIGGRGYTESGPEMRFAAKRLTRSDLTFFEYQFRRQNAGNQKSINLNRDVFVDLLFPLAASMAGGIARQFPVPVSIYGPGLRATRHLITRKVIAAGGSQKNWRLNGEFVPDPDDDPARYHGLAEKDLAVFGFEGDRGVPTAVYMVLLARSESDDAGPSGEVDAFLGTRSMSELPADVLSGIAERSPPGHPVRELLETDRDQAMEEAALGSAEGTAQLLRKPSARRLTADALATAREAAEAAGPSNERWDMRQSSARLKKIWVPLPSS